jgi:hypothetical protein
MAGPEPAIQSHQALAIVDLWMAGSSPAMEDWNEIRRHRLSRL